MVKKIEYISPSALSLWQESPDDYYLKYLSTLDIPRMPQTKPMSIGSAFDAFVKSYMHNCLFGGSDPRFEERTLFEAQVEPALRAWAWDNGKYVFEQYKQSGALADLMLLLGDAKEPRFEFEVRGVVNGFREGVKGQFGQVTLLGKPDVDFITASGVHVILDFKVNGYCSNASPAPYYLRLRGAGKTNHGMHAKCHPMLHEDVEINAACALEDLPTIGKKWAQQLAIYGWLCGEPIGERFVTIIHQLVCSRNSNMNGLPKIRVAEHHNFIRPSFQQQVFDSALNLWERVHSGHFFRECSETGEPWSLERSQEYAKRLESLADDRVDQSSILERLNAQRAR